MTKFFFSLQVQMQHLKFVTLFQQLPPFTCEHSTHPNRLASNRIQYCTRKVVTKIELDTF